MPDPGDGQGVLLTHENRDGHERTPDDLLLRPAAAAAGDELIVPPRKVHAEGGGARATSTGPRDFQVVKLLGKGDVGKVYLVRRRATGMLYAMKVVAKEQVIRRRKFHRLQTEWEALRQFDHPFVAKLCWFFQSRRKVYFIMDFCEGGEFFRFLQRQRGGVLTESAARFYAAEVLVALEYLHLNGLIYRDVKPENILMDREGHLLITDFDLSKLTEVTPKLLMHSAGGTEGGDPAHNSSMRGASLRGVPPLPAMLSAHNTPGGRHGAPPPGHRRQGSNSSAASNRSNKSNRSNGGPASPAEHLFQVTTPPGSDVCGSFVGTAEYIAPEMVQKNATHNHSVDFWGFGVLIYEMLYGYTPFRGRDQTETFRRIAQDPHVYFPRTPSVSAEVKDLIKALLNPCPAKRLGGAHGAMEVKNHPWFKGLNFALIRNTTPPLPPVLTTPAPAADLPLILEEALSDSDPDAFMACPKMAQMVHRASQPMVARNGGAILKPQYPAGIDPFTLLTPWENPSLAERRYTVPTPGAAGGRKLRKSEARLLERASSLGNGLDRPPRGGGDARGRPGGTPGRDPLAPGRAGGGRAAVDGESTRCCICVSRKSTKRLPGAGGTPGVPSLVPPPLLVPAERPEGGGGVGKSTSPGINGRNAPSPRVVNEPAGDVETAGIAAGALPSESTDLSIPAASVPPVGACHGTPCTSMPDATSTSDATVGMRSPSQGGAGGAGGGVPAQQKTPPPARRTHSSSARTHKKKLSNQGFSMLDVEDADADADAGGCEAGNTHAGVNGGGGGGTADATSVHTASPNTSLFDIDGEGVAGVGDAAGGDDRERDRDRDRDCDTPPAKHAGKRDKGGGSKRGAIVYRNKKPKQGFAVLEEPEVETPVGGGDDDNDTDVASLRTPAQRIADASQLSQLSEEEDAHAYSVANPAALLQAQQPAVVRGKKLSASVEPETPGCPPFADTEQPDGSCMSDPVEHTLDTSRTDLSDAVAAHTLTPASGAPDAAKPRHKQLYRPGKPAPPQPPPPPPATHHLPRTLSSPGSGSLAATPVTQSQSPRRSRIGTPPSPQQPGQVQKRVKAAGAGAGGKATPGRPTHADPATPGQS